MDIDRQLRCPECGCPAPNHEEHCCGLPDHVEYDWSEANPVPLDFRVPGQCLRCGESEVFLVASRTSTDHSMELVPYSVVDTGLLYECSACKQFAMEVITDA